MPNVGTAKQNAAGLKATGTSLPARFELWNTAENRHHRFEYAER